MAAEPFKKTMFCENAVRLLQNADGFERYDADLGYVLPYMYKDDNIVIVPFQQCEKNVRFQVCVDLMSEFHDEIKCDTATATESYINKNWQGGDIMYILMIAGCFRGCIAIDRKNFFTFLSHLYVVPAMRGKGLSKLLLQFVEYVTRLQNITIIKLWCSKNMQPFYESRGYSLNHVQEPMCIMEKKLFDEEEPVGATSIDAYGVW